MVEGASSESEHTPPSNDFRSFGADLFCSPAGGSSFSKWTSKQAILPNYFLPVKARGFGLRSGLGTRPITQKEWRLIRVPLK
ncbi:hypothetical protein AVEN_199295-1, partial [Araneus ventricosus]